MFDPNYDPMAQLDELQNRFNQMQQVVEEMVRLYNTQLNQNQNLIQSIKNLNRRIQDLENRATIKTSTGDRPVR